MSALELLLTLGTRYIALLRIIGNSSSSNLLYIRNDRPLLCNYVITNVHGKVAIRYLPTFVLLYILNYI